MIGYQADGASPIVQDKVISNPQTIASAICIGNPQSWKDAVECKIESKGWFSAVSDQDILLAQKELSSLEGIYIEPAAAAAIGVGVVGPAPPAATPPRRTAVAVAPAAAVAGAGAGRHRPVPPAPRAGIRHHGDEECSRTGDGIAGFHPRLRGTDGALGARF